MQSSTKDVATYIKESPAARKAALTKLRRLCREVLKGYAEGMDYGMPSYKRDGTVEVAFASQSNYISLYILNAEVMTANRQLLKGLNCGKSCIRYGSPEKINFDTIRTLLQETARSKAGPC